MVGIGFGVSYKYTYCILENKIIDKTKDNCFRFIITSGEEKKLFLSSTNFPLEKGSDFFKDGKYEQAIKFFKMAIAADPTNPISQIYLNNAEARLRGNSLKIAVTQGIDYYENVSKEVLRGVADAQTKFNEINNENKNNPLLEIVIANDGNDPVISPKIAEALANKPDILGVIGHLGSDSSWEAIPIYEKNGIPMVSPSSTGSDLNDLKSKVFFRSTLSTKDAASVYADYIHKHLHSGKLAIFYDSSNEHYSKILTADIEEALKKRGEGVNIFYIDLNNNDSLEEDLKKQGEGVNIFYIDLNNDNLDIDKEIENLVKQNIKVAFVLSSVKTNILSLVIAKKNYALSPNKKLQLVGALVLDEEETLSKGGKAVEGMIVLRPCLKEDSPYMKEAAERWQQKAIYWRTATSYDAAQAFIKVITKIRSSGNQPTRENILKNLQSLTLSPDETSGYGLSWNHANSNSERKHCRSQIHNGKFEQF